MIEVSETEAAARSTQRTKLVAGVALGVVVVDQLTKQWALSALADGPIDVFWTLRFRLLFNSGSAFGFGSQWGRILAILVIVVIVALWRYSRNFTSKPALIATGAVLGGAVGNLIDRFFRADDGIASGAVVDFIDFQWWPVFNVADIAVVVGAICLGLFAIGSEAGMQGPR